MKHSLNELRQGRLKGGGGVGLIVGFQPLMVISPTASWIRWCMQVYACELMWTCLVWSERSTPDRCHRCNSATGEQIWITQTIYTDSEPPSRLPNSLMPSAKLRSANLPVFTSLVWLTRSGIEPRPPAPRPSGRSNHCAIYTQGRLLAVKTPELWNATQNTPLHRYVITPRRPATSITCSTFWGIYTGLHASRRTGNPSTLSSQSLTRYHLRLSEPGHHWCYPLMLGFKKDDRMNKEKYRPVSVLPCVSTPYEYVMFDQWMEYFGTILAPRQSVSLPKRL